MLLFGAERYHCCAVSICDICVTVPIRSLHQPSVVTPVPRGGTLAPTQHGNGTIFANTPQAEKTDGFVSCGSSSCVDAERLGELSRGERGLVVVGLMSGK